MKVDEKIKELIEAIKKDKLFQKEKMEIVDTEKVLGFYDSKGKAIMGVDITYSHDGEESVVTINHFDEINEKNARKVVEFMLQVEEPMGEEE